MKKTAKILTAIIMAGGLTVFMTGTGAQAGNETATTGAQQLAKGMEKDVVAARMGEPDQVVPFPGGMESWTYAGINNRPDTEKFIPANNAASGNRNLVILFGSDDTVRNFNFTAPK